MDSITLLSQHLVPRLSQLWQGFLQLWQSVQAAAATPAGSSSSSPELEQEITSILDDLRSVESASAWIKAAVADAEERAVRGEKLVRQWLIDLQHLSYRAADLRGLYEYEVMAQETRHREAQRLNSKAVTAGGKRKLQDLLHDQVHGSAGYPSSSPLSSPLVDPSFRREFARDIREFREKFDEINKVKEALDFDEEDWQRLNRMTDDIIDHQPTGSEPVDDVFVGREEDTQELIGLLLTDDGEEDNDPHAKTVVPVIALVGMGGVGKTTLTQHAFNDPQVCKHFPKRGWVNVSDDFNVHRLTKSTMEALDVVAPWSNSEKLSVLQHYLKDAVEETKFLLVLDDVWNEKAAVWDAFYRSLKDGAKGSKIIITTRNKTVCDAAEAMKRVDVSCLSEEDAWELFRMYAFGNHDISSQIKHYPTLLSIGKNIARNCRGLPLAIKVLGSYLRYEDKNDDIWNNVLNSDLWEPHMWGEGEQILGPLMLSYLRLPEHLKPCFLLCCGVFPKDREISTEVLIELWMAHELIEDCDADDTGMRYIYTLVTRSFFSKDLSSQDSTGSIIVHDLMHDLAQLVSRDKSFYSLAGYNKISGLSICPSVHHAWINVADDNSVRLCHDQHNSSSLRTLVPGPYNRTMVLPQPVCPNYTLVLQNPNLFKLDGLRVLAYFEPKSEEKCAFLLGCLKISKNLRCLRLSLFALTQDKIDAICAMYNLRKLEIILPYGYGSFLLPEAVGENLRQLTSLRIINNCSQLPDSIGCLTRLRKLELQRGFFRSLPDNVSKLVNLKELRLFYTLITSLPESIGNLRSLEVLNLSWCLDLEKLPQTLVHLTNLTELDLSGTSIDCYFPFGIGGLKKLQRLPLFRVSSKASSYSSPSEEVHEAGGGGIDELRDLVAIGGDLTIQRLENVIKPEDAMRAELIKKTFIRSIVLVWKGSKTGGEISTVKQTQDEEVLLNLRPHHENLEEVSIVGWRGRILASWLGDSSFVSLRKISLRDLLNCTSLCPLHHLPALKYLECEGMMSLVHLTRSSPTPLPSQLEDICCCFPVLKELKITLCPQLDALVDVSMPSLQMLDLSRCDLLTRLPTLPSLQKLGLKDCDSLTCIPPLPFVKELEFTGCKSLAGDRVPFGPFPAMERLGITGDFPIPVFHLLFDSLPSSASLKSLKVKDLKSSTTLPLDKLPAALEALSVTACPNLQFSDTTKQIPSSLKSLCISEAAPSLVESVLKGIPKRGLEKLEISRIPGHFDLPLDSFSSLKNIRVAAIDCLTCVPLDKLHALERLNIHYCSNAWFSDSSYLPSPLRHLGILRCPRLKEWCETHRRSKLAHFAQLRLDHEECQFFDYIGEE